MEEKLYEEMFNIIDIDEGLPRCSRLNILFRVHSQYCSVRSS